jgi:DNA polymerase III alpha subunit (gram-positive type)
MNKYLAFDTETGGTSTDSSILSCFMAALDKNLQITDTLSLLIKPDDGIYKVGASALKVNKINLIEHDKNAVSYTVAHDRLLMFLRQVSYPGNTSLIPLGHNVHFDINFICEHILNHKSWHKFVGYRHLDTATFAMCLIEAGILPSSVSPSLEKLANFFQLKLTESETHTAQGDTLLTIKVYKELLNLAKRNVWSV